MSRIEATLAALKVRKNSGASVQMASISENSRSGGGFFARLFGGGADDAEEQDRVRRPVHREGLPGLGLR